MKTHQKIQQRTRKIASMIYNKLEEEGNEYKSLQDAIEHADPNDDSPIVVHNHNDKSGESWRYPKIRGHYRTFRYKGLNIRIRPELNGKIKFIHAVSSATKSKKDLLELQRYLLKMV